MNLQQITTIDEIIVLLDHIIAESELNNDPLGYFAALYQKVTIRVKEGIAIGFFDNGQLIEQLDVIFAKRYLQAYYDYQNKQAVTESWKRAFEVSDQYWPIVLQHLLLGMNAHINLDLGIAATEVSRKKNIADLKGDFDRINEILSKLVHEVEDNLSVVWPLLKYILKWSGKIDDYLVDFSMKLARDGAWKFANELALVPEAEIESSLAIRDVKVANKINVILTTDRIAMLTLKIIRITERGTISDKIQKLRIPNTISNHPEF